VIFTFLLYQIRVVSRGCAVSCLVAALFPLDPRTGVAHTS
jgi:hypothetical protein